MEITRQSDYIQITRDAGRTIDPTSAGLCLGTLTGACHLMWSLLVAVGWAQPLINFVFKLHFIEPVYRVTPFELGSATLLVVITTLSGFAFGYIFAQLWNGTSRRI